MNSDSPGPSVPSSPARVGQRARDRQCNYRLLFFVTANLVLALFFVNTEYLPNQASRALPVLSWIMQGDLNIDEYEQWSLDKAKIGDHYYTDKAPLTTFLLLAVAVPLDALSVFDHSQMTETYRALIGLGAVINGSVPFLVVLFLCYATARRFVGESEAMIIAMLLLYGSNLFVYAGVLWGHMLCGALLVVGLHLLVDRNAPVAAGLSLGASVAVEYPAILAVLVFVAIDTACHRSAQRLLGLALGGAPAMAALMTYHYVHTGSPFEPPYLYESDERFDEMKQAFGFHLPSLEVIGLLLSSGYRGIFFFSPALLYFLYRIPRTLIRDPSKNPLAPYVLVAALAYLIMNASYYRWSGGWCHGPRHLVPALSLIVYLCVSLLKGGRFGWPFYALSLLGVVTNWMTKSVGELYQGRLSEPFLAYVWENFIEGHFTNWTILDWATGGNLVGPLVWLPAFAMVLAALHWLPLGGPTSSGASSRHET